MQLIANPNQFEKDFIETDKKNLMESAKRKNFKIFPIPNDANNKWVSSLELGEAGLKGMDLHIRRVFYPYFSLNNASKSGDYKTLMTCSRKYKGFKEVCSR
jgi:hypothetical protein